MLWLVLLTAPAQMVQLGPPRPLMKQVVLRYQPGVARLAQPLDLLKTCALQARLPAPFDQPLEIRVVGSKWLNRAFKRPPSSNRHGRYYVAKDGHPALIYVADNRDRLISLAHEWMHHLAAVHRRNWSEQEVERRANACAPKTP